MNIFDQVLTTPLSNLFFLLLKTLTDPGLTTIIFSLLIRIPLTPLYWFIHQKEDQIKKIQLRVKNETKEIKDLMKQAEVVQRIYAEEKFKPLTSFTLQLSPLPIFFALFAVFNRLQKSTQELLFFQIINLKQPNVILATLTLVFQLALLGNQPKETKKFAYFSIGLIGIVLFTVPSIFTLYWLVILLWTLLERQFFHFLEKTQGVKASAGTR